MHQPSGMNSHSKFASGFLSGFGPALWGFGFARLATLGGFAWEQIQLIWEVEDELRKMHRTFLNVQDIVDHVESSPLRFNGAGGSKAWQILFEDLQKLSYDADALLDHVWLHLSSNQRKSVSSGSILKSREFDVPHEINKMQAKLDELAGEMKNLISMEQVKMAIHKRKAMERSWFGSDYLDNSSLLFDAETIIGRDKDKDDLIEFLGEEGDKLSVISLVAMGGMGKTTLAQLVYNDNKFCSDFGLTLKIWVSVSTNFDVRRITKSIIESITRQTCTLCDLDSLQLKLQHLISEEKFLLVLDDYWNENFNDWDLLSAPLRYGLKGSKIIVTTRSNMASSIVGSVRTYNPQKLTDDDCWKLMKQRALFQKEEEIKKGFESLGRDIAKKCKGLPLVAKTLGSILHHKSTHDEWRYIANSELGDLPLDETGILPSLMLSYVHLPAPLQKCFAYCSLFPQDYEFEVEQLVLFWMAEGFIQPQGERSLEEIGKDYFNHLLMRSFFDHSGKSPSNTSVYKMHSFFHDLACLVSTNTCSQIKDDVQNSYPLFRNACHLSLHHQTTQRLELNSSLKNKRLRTFMVVCKGSVEGKIHLKLFSHLKFLRTLYLFDLGLKVLPDTIEHLIYLRCINLCRNKIEGLPESMCKLEALQTLMLLECRELKKLPDDLKNVSNLRHLLFEMSLTAMPPKFGELTNLHTLTAFIVSKIEGHGIEQLEKMDSLNGSLRIKNINRVSNAKDAEKAQLKMKKYLNKLQLQWENIDGALAKQNQVSVLDNLEPHEDLRELEIQNYRGTRCPNWLSDPKHKFTKIELVGLVNCEALPSLGQLPVLEHLLIFNMKALKRVDQNFYGNGNGAKFPSLVCLEIMNMDTMDEWMQPNSCTCMPLLKTLKIVNCQILKQLPEHLGSVPCREIYHCPGLEPPPPHA